ncbi:TetR/AcrR family transcriptional regulator [Cohnella lupini]|uniref:TetR family transcriptional regulator n=1 Tax=Cohnella lupini TaxID=1294267 RepID=A0A3D9I1R6_9BACL|nr:TetR/AcrR family transcriptional regulator [Cohnella lupini]RED55684.1 TetR family transcriptional regulator [Cohnella lupini]
MQVLKDDIRQTILRASRDEFAQYGYRGASVKRIADKVGISVGNLYRYYKGKEALFDSIAAPLVHELEGLINAHENRSQDNGSSIFDGVVHALTAIVEEFRIPLLILIDGAIGTRYEDAVRKIHQAMANNIASHLSEYNRKQGREEFEEEAAWPISVAFMQGYFEIIRRNEDPEDCRRMVRQYVSFWYQGLRVFV